MRNLIRVHSNENQWCKIGHKKRIFRDGGAKTKVERGPGGGEEQRG